MRANIYVDGFNLYYGLARGTAYKWLDLSKLCTLLLPGDRINRIRYFTARIQPRPDDRREARAQRQQAYIRALETIPNLTVHYGHFLERRARMPLANPAARGRRTVEVLRTEEKGSDVNLTTFLLVDGFERDYELAVIVSNDSDLVEPIRVVRSKLGLEVGVLNPQRNTSHALRKAAGFYRPIRLGALKASQFPDTLKDVRGTIRKPRGW